MITRPAAVSLSVSLMISCDRCDAVAEFPRHLTTGTVTWQSSPLSDSYPERDHSADVAHAFHHVGWETA